jgi:hypothetical protein
MTTFPVTSAPIATGTPPAADDDDDDDAICPYPRRCEDGCKQAFFAAFAVPENNVDPSLIPADVATQIATCVVGCDQNRADNAQGCVGAATEAECACRAACERTANLSGRVSPEAAVKMRRAMRNLEAAVAPACL